MTTRARRSVLVVALVLTALFVAPTTHRARAQDQQQVASVEQLKLSAFQALKTGQFAQANENIAQAASISQDPTLQQMASWVKQFEDQRQTFAAERHKQYEKAVADVHKLLEHHKEGYALDWTAKAGLLSDDKKAFRNEPWVDALVKRSIELAKDYDSKEQWLKALRVYSDLS